MMEEKAKLIIDTGTYNFDLRQHIWKLKYAEPGQIDTLTIISKIMSVNLLESEVKDLKKQFDGADLSILRSTELILSISNEEVVARWLDVLLTLDRKYIMPFISIARSKYLKVFQATSDCKYIIRALQLVKYAKSVFEQNLKEFFEEAKAALYGSKESYWQQKILVELVSIFGHDKCQREFFVFLNDQSNSFLQQLDFTSARFSIRSLNVIKVLSGNECQIRIGESYESEGDLSVSEKKPNTFYPAISQTYLKGLREIESVAGCEQLRNRLKKKVAEAQKEDFKMIQVAGVRVTPHIDVEEVHKKVLELNINSFTSAFQVLLDIPIIPKKLIDEQAFIDQKTELGLSQFFSKNVKINSKGAQVANQELSEAYKNNARIFHRERMMAFIQVVKSKLDGYGEFSKSLVDGFLRDSKSPFVPENRMYVYVMGISEGFDNNFISAAHILMPQIENSLRTLAEQNGIIVTSYEKELQLENVLGGCLDKVQPLATPDIIEELKSFLVDGNNVNFRNELSHGLVDEIFIHKYGMYLWWLSLKLITRTKEFFPTIR